MLVETGKKIFCLPLDTGKQSGTFRPLGIQWCYNTLLSNFLLSSVK